MSKTSTLANGTTVASVIFEAMKAALSDVDGIDAEQVSIHDLARRTTGEVVQRAAEAGVTTWNIAAEADAMSEAGFDYRRDPEAAGEDSLDALFAALSGLDG